MIGLAQSYCLQNMDMDNDTWSDLIIERAARPLPLSEDRFRQWMAGRGIFVSSRMDNEMNPFREGVRTYLHRLGATPVMWEEIAPRDEQAQRAYLNGVDQSSICILMLGRGYGATDASGYSPTHQEANRAAERKIPRLLFTPAGIQSSERDGRLNDWLNSLYNEISGATFTTTDDLVAQLDARLREMAAQAERIWVKLGSLIFPGKVTTSFGITGGGQFTVTARVSQGDVRHTLLALGQPFGYTRAQADRLTWSSQSFPVRVESISTEAEFAADDAVRIVCSIPQNWYGESGSPLADFSIDGGMGRRTIGPVDLAGIWARRAILGEEMNSDSNPLDLVSSCSAPWSEPLIETES